MTEHSKCTIEYGIEGKYMDVTNIALSQCTKDNILSLPGSDHGRAAIFGDPILNVVKNIRVTINDVSTVYNYDETIRVDVSGINNEDFVFKTNTRSWYDNTIADPIRRLELIHNNMKFIGGNIREEYPEQLMVTTFLKSGAKVLELGSNIGRNTLTIATILWSILV